MSSSRLRISTLGILRLSELGASGEVIRTRRVDGYKNRALLLTLIFYPRTSNRLEIDRLIRGVPDHEADLFKDGGEKRIREAIYTASRRLKQLLEPYDDLITHGEEDLRLLRSDRVLIDWDDLLEAKRLGNHRQVLSMIEGDPLQGVSEESSRFQELPVLREMVRSQAHEALEALGETVPTSLQLGQHLPDCFEPDLPPEWRHRPDAPRHTFVSEPRKRRRVSEADPSAGLYEDDELFDPNPEGKRRLVDELSQASREGLAPWWNPDDGRWFGAYFAFKHSPHSIPAAQIKVAFTGVRLDSVAYQIPSSDPDQPYDGDNDKYVFLRSSNLFGDNRDHKRIECARTNWNFAQKWAVKNGQRILDSPAVPSVFGIEGRTPHPGIAGAHALVQTADGYLLFGLRGSGVDYYPLEWSASFEESLSVIPREFTGQSNGDETLADPVVGGLYEEWGIDADEVAEISCLALGRQFVRVSRHQLDMSSTAILGVRLKIGLDQVWSRLDQGSRIRDRDEHRSWAGCRFQSRSDVHRFLVAARQYPAGTDLLQKAIAQGDCQAELEVYPGGASENVEYNALMPTSPARLYLGSAWLWENGWME